MQAIDIEGASRKSTVLVGERLQQLGRYLPAGRTVIITDENVLRFHGKEFPAFPVLRIGTGEGVKTLDTVRGLYQSLVALEADRSTFLVGIGGGIVCDVAGFTAATFMRGLRFGFVATTLLAQVDASVGGKNGVNLEGYKNLVGSFSQPEFVLCDLQFLRTLPEPEVVNGMAEIAKHAMIADAAMFAFIEANADRALALDPPVVERLVRDSVRIKGAVVDRDEHEAGERRMLNFGHTFGHALEKAGRFSHGEAVSIGMALAAAISVRRGRLSAAACDRILRLFKLLHLPCAASIDLRRLADAIRRDKKRAGDTIHYVLLDDIGKAAVEEIGIDELMRLASDFPDIIRNAS
ncbi:MAG: 3-dehydroquinate synthase [Deltaproteobacteria bacterium]|nr:3-dehydroquinate synthase [Deltaproteobacteria bacterium]